MNRAIAIFPAVESSLSVDEILTLFEETKNKHAQVQPAVVLSYVSLLEHINEAIVVDRRMEWLVIMDNAVRTLEVVKAALLDSELPEDVVKCLTTSIALSLLIKRAETNDVIRRKSEEILNSDRFPFDIPRGLKAFVGLFIASINLFWVALEQIRAIAGLNMEVLVEGGFTDLVETQRVHCIWLSSLFTLDTTSLKKSLLLSNCVVFIDIVSHSGQEESNAARVVMR